MWPDDVVIPSALDGRMICLGGRERYFIAHCLLVRGWEQIERNRVPITEYIISRAGETPVMIGDDNFQEIVRHRGPSTAEKVDRLVQYLVSRSDGQMASTLFGAVPQEDYTACRAVGIAQVTELFPLVDFLGSEGLVTQITGTGFTRVWPTVKAFMRVEAARAPRTSRAAFVAMWFAPEMDVVYRDAMLPAIEANGYKPIRVDLHPHNNKIDDEIIAAIRRARFVVADVSCGPDGARGGVYYEAGFAHGLGVQVIFSVRRADLERVHFDTRQFNHIIWETSDDLFQQLKARIGATIGEYGANA